jgi:hypothetical protein
MPTAETSIRTDRAAVYLARLCSHAGKMSTVTRLHRHQPDVGGSPPRFQDIQQADDEATVTLDCGQWTVRADQDQLFIRVVAPDQESLVRIQDMLTTRLRALGSREQLGFAWLPASGPEGRAQPR